jgi:hypothetical protein
MAAPARKPTFEIKKKRETFPNKKRFFNQFFFSQSIQLETTVHKPTLNRIWLVNFIFLDVLDFFPNTANE